MADMIKCAHCGEKRPALGYAPFPNALGQRIGAEICQQPGRPNDETFRAAETRREP